MMESLFSVQPARQFPSQAKPRRASRQRRADQYGPSNPSIFTIVLRTEDDARPAPIKRTPALYTLEQKDPYGEWQDAHADEHGAVLYALLRLPSDYTASVAHIRAQRPANPNEALKWWRIAVNRAHLLNVLLCRGHRSIAQLHRDMALKTQGSSRLHEYLHRWGITWVRPDRDVTLTDGAATNYPARVVAFHRDTGEADVRLADYTLTVRARFDARQRSYRTPATITVGSLVPLPVAAAVLGLTDNTARTVLPIATHTDTRMPLINPDDLARTVPERLWRCTVQDALRDANPCRCAFWNHHAARCDVGHTTLPQRGTAAYACEDHAHDA